MKKKNGFISTSVIYSFFLIFITLFLALILNYMHSRMLLNKVNESAQNDINKLKNASISNLNVGDYVIFKLDSEHPFDMINESTYILANKYEESGNNIYEFYSSTNAVNSSYNSGNEFISINKILNNKDNIKNNIIYSTTNTNLSVDLLNTESLKRVRDIVTDNNILNNIYNTDTDYVIYNNLTGTSYTDNSYYNVRRYNFSSNMNNISDLLLSYCNLTYSDENVVYPSNNIFGYGNTLSATITTPKYVNYCYYSNPENYSHLASDGIVDKDETKPSDLVPNGNTESDNQDEVNQKNYNYRLMIKINLNDSNGKDKFEYGKGTKEDPYVLLKGGKE